MKLSALIVFMSLLSLTSLAGWQGAFDEVYFAQTASSTNTPSTLGDGLIVHYKMNDNAASVSVVDSKGTNTGTAQQNTSVLATNGLINGALSFNGSTDYISANEGILSNSAQFSFSLWVKPASVDSASYYRGIIAKGSYNSGGFELVQKLATADGSMYLVVGADLLEPTTKLSAGNWIHIAAAGTSSNVNLYFNSQYDSTVNSVFSNSTNLFRLGLRQPEESAAYYFNGDIDDVRIYDRTLTTNEIAELYNAGAGTEDE
jgi:hypothetical protein